MLDPPSPNPPPDQSPEAAARAERARRNGARSRGPVTDSGKATASRNALRHGLCAKVHLVLAGEDEAAFAALAGQVLGELAPEGIVAGFLAARLAAAMWQTGRADRLEAQAFAAGAVPDADRLRLALRYRGSIGRDLFRTLRELREQRRAMADTDSPAAADTAPGAAAGLPASSPPAENPSAPTLADLAAHAWGGPRGEPPPPGFLLVRPVDGIPPRSWRWFQDRAFPGAEPLLVYADGSVRARTGELLPDRWTPPDNPTLRHGLTAADLPGPAETAEAARKRVPAARPAEPERLPVIGTDEPERPSVSDPTEAENHLTICTNEFDDCTTTCTCEPEAGPAMPTPPGSTGDATGPSHGLARQRNEPSQPGADGLEPEAEPAGDGPAAPISDGARSAPRPHLWQRKEPSNAATDPAEPAAARNVRPAPRHARWRRGLHQRHAASTPEPEAHAVAAWSTAPLDHAGQPYPEPSQPALELATAEPDPTSPPEHRATAAPPPPAPPAAEPTAPPSSDAWSRLWNLPPPSAPRARTAARRDPAPRDDQDRT